MTRRSTPADMQHREAIRTEQVRLLYANAPAGFVATGVNALLLAFAQWAVISPLVILPWLTYMLTLTMLRAALVWRFQQAEPAPHRMGQWGVLFGIGAGLAGIGWGGAGVVLFPSASITHQVFLAFVLGGMIAGSVGLLAPRMPVFLSFVVPTALPVIIRLLAQGDRMPTIMGGMAALFTLAIVFTAWKFHRIILTSLYMRFDNADLVDSVTAEKARVDRLNAQLTAEIAERQRAEDALRTVYADLEVRVEDRTAELAATLAQLHAQMDERQQLAEQLQQAQKMETVGRLAGSVAHDFNNLLTVILGYTTLGISTSPSLPALRTYLADIQSAAQRAADLTQQLLAFSRRQMIDPEVINLNDLLLSMLPMQRRIIRENIDLVTLLAPDLWLTWADPGQMQRVVMNLVMNAHDAMLNGGKLTVETMNVSLDKLSLRHYPEVNPGDYVLLAISDTGVGMTDEIMAQIFEPFFTTKGVGQGTGLGLSSCYGIVAQTGGCITVDSQVDCGTTFKVYLPRAEEEARTEQSSEDLTYLPRGNETVLVVEDEPAIRNLISHILQDQGYYVLQAANGIAALVEATRQTKKPVDLLITDMVMPQMGGIELAEQLRAMWPDIRVLFISGYTNLVDARDLMALGSEFLQKPFLSSTLAVKARELLDKTPASYEIEHDKA